MRGLGDRTYAARAWHREGERPTCLYAGGVGGNTTFIVALREEAAGGRVGGDSGVTGEGLAQGGADGE